MQFNQETVKNFFYVYILFTSDFIFIMVLSLLISTIMNYIIIGANINVFIVILDSIISFGLTIISTSLTIYKDTLSSRDYVWTFTDVGLLKCSGAESSFKASMWKLDHKLKSVVYFHFQTFIYEGSIHTQEKFPKLLSCF